MTETPITRKIGSSSLLASVATCKDIDGSRTQSPEALASTTTTTSDNITTFFDDSISKKQADITTAAATAYSVSPLTSNRATTASSSTRSQQNQQQPSSSSSSSSSTSPSSKPVVEQKQQQQQQQQQQYFTQEDLQKYWTKSSDKFIIMLAVISLTFSCGSLNLEDVKRIYETRGHESYLSTPSSILVSLGERYGVTALIGVYLALYAFYMLVNSVLNILCYGRLSVQPTEAIFSAVSKRYPDSSKMLLGEKLGHSDTNNNNNNTNAGTHNSSNPLPNRGWVLLCLEFFRTVFSALFVALLYLCFGNQPHWLFCIAYIFVQLIMLEYYVVEDVRSWYISLSFVVYSSIVCAAMIQAGCTFMQIGVSSSIVVVFASLMNSTLFFIERGIDCDYAKIANGAKSRFISNMSHELRTPLYGIMASADLLMLDSPNLASQHLECVTNIKYCSTILTHLISDILDITKIEENQMQLYLGPFDIPSAATELIEGVFRQQALKKNLYLEYHVDPDIVDNVEVRNVIGDRKRFSQILMNLIGNAVKFCSVGGVTVHIGCYKGDDQPEDKVGIEVTVEDTGVGIPKERSHLLFQRFSQIDSSPTKRFEGAGLGLAISQSLIKMMGGSISFESIENVRTSFKFHVFFDRRLGPDPCETLSVGTTRQGISLPSAPHSLNILLVDDNTINTRVLSRLVKKLLEEMKIDARVDTADNGRIAYEQYLTMSYDLIFLDLYMPECNGMECAEKIRSSEAGGKHRAYIIALTACVEKGVRDRCKLGGMDDFLAKPCSLSALQIAIDKFILSRAMV